MKIPFRFRPQLFNTCFHSEEGAISSGVGGTPPPASTDAAASPAVGETFGVTLEEGQSTGNVTATNETETATAEPDIFEGIPSREQLEAEVAQKVPHSEAVLRLRTELERVNPELKQYEPWKPIVEGNDPKTIQERLQTHDSLFSPKLVDGQPVLDERNLPQTTVHPFLENMEAKRPGYAMEMLVDVLDYEAVNPATGQKEPLVGQFLREVLGLDVAKLKDYQNIDALIAKTNGSITPDELETAIPESLDKSHLTDRDLYKQLRPNIRKDWQYLDAETRRDYLDDVKERMVNRQFREQQIQSQKQAAEAEKQEFEATVRQSFVQDLTQVREQAFSSLRDNLARDWQPSLDPAINEDRYDDVLAPLAQLIDPDLQPMALKRLEREGIKVNVQEFNEQMRSMVNARQTYVRAQAYKDGIAAERALKDYTTLNLRLMAKFSTIAFQRAEKYGYQAKAIAESKGELLTAATTVRPTVPGSTVPQAFSASGLPAGMDPRSSEAAMLQWQQSRPQTA